MSTEYPLMNYNKLLIKMSDMFCSPFPDDQPLRSALPLPQNHLLLGPRFLHAAAASLPITGAPELGSNSDGGATA